MKEYSQVSSPTSFPKKGKMSKVKETPKGEAHVLKSMYDAAPVGSVPPGERTIESNQYAKMPKDRSKQGKGDLAAETRTETYIYDTYLRSR